MNALNVIELTKSLVKIPSVNPFTTVSHDSIICGIGDEQRINIYIEDFLKNNGFTVTRQLVQEEKVALVDSRQIQIPARWNILAEKGEGASSVLLFGHTDTVDVKAGWDHDPFTGAEISVDGRTRFLALGANDMKSGLAVIMTAGAKAQPKGWKLKLAFLVDEEFWSFGAVQLTTSEFLSDVRLAFVPELIDEQTPIDTQWVGLGRLGRSEFVFKIKGRACHGADAFTDTESINAVHEAIKLEHALLQYINDSRRVFHEEDLSVINSSYISRHHGGKGILSVPDEAEFILDRSFIPGENETEELAKLEALLPTIKFEAKIDPRAEISVALRKRPTPPCQSYFCSPKNALISKALNVVQATNKKVIYGIGRSVADENRIANLGIPTLVLGPNGACSHTAREWVDLQSVANLERTYSELLKQDWSSH